MKIRVLDKKRNKNRPVLAFMQSRRQREMDKICVFDVAFLHGTLGWTADLSNGHLMELGRL